MQPQRGEIPVKLVNPGLHAITLEPNTKIGEVTSITYSVNTSLVSQNNSYVVNNISLPKNYLSDEQQVQLINVLKKYTDVFAHSDSDLGCTNILEHAVDTHGHTPILQRSYRVPQAQREVIETHIRDMANRGIIKPSKSPWSSPVVLAGKKDGSTRFCVDFRKLNAVTRKDPMYPLPRIDETLDTLGGAFYFTTLDLASGYWQVPLKEEDIPKTAFSSHTGLWEFTVMPFGLCGAPATFQLYGNRTCRS